MQVVQVLVVPRHEAQGARQGRHTPLSCTVLAGQVAKHWVPLNKGVLPPQDTQVDALVEHSRQFELQGKHWRPDWKYPEEQVATQALFSNKKGAAQVAQTLAELQASQLRLQSRQVPAELNVPVGQAATHRELNKKGEGDWQLKHKSALFEQVRQLVLQRRQVSPSTYCPAWQVLLQTFPSKRGAEAGQVIQLEAEPAQVAQLEAQAAQPPVAVSY